VGWRERSVGRLTCLTPEVAQEWLAGQKNVAKLIPGKVEMFAALMLDDAWPAGTVVIFDKAGRMVNGQHRCHAVILTGVTIKVQIAADPLPRHA
jgi:hypothetical protein